jgi:signal transduction histidine kinase
MEADGRRDGLPERQSLRRMAQGVAVLSLTMAVVGLGMVVASFVTNGGMDRLPVHLHIHFFVALVFSFFALLILQRHPQHTVGWLTMVVGFAASLQFLINGYIAFDRDVIIGNTDTAMNIAILLDNIVWWPIEALPFTLIPLFFPDGMLPSPRWRAVVMIVVLGVLSGMLTGFHPGPVAFGNTFYNPAGIKGSGPFLEKLGVLSLVLMVIGGIGCFLGVCLRFRRSTGIERLQMKWLVYIATVLLIVQLPLVVFSYMAPVQHWIHPLLNILSPLLIFVFPVTCAIAIVRHRHWDIDLLINRTLVYAGLTAVIVLLYSFVVVGVSTALQTRSLEVSGLIAAGLIAVLFQPVRDRLQRGVNRMMYGERDDPAAVLTRLAHHLETADTPSAILPNLVQTIAHLLKIPYVAIAPPVAAEQVAADQMEPVAVWGKASNNVQTIPLTYQREDIGQLMVAPRGPHERFTRYEQELLATIAALTATTVRAVQLSDDVRRSRQRIVSAREDERRRLRRDLHDGLGPQLASQMLELEAVAQLMSSNPAKAQSLLASLKAQAEEVIVDLRGLVYGLRPPALDDLGLIGALRQSASRYESGALRFTFETHESLPDLPAAVETALYRIALEAMTNVARHAQATRCTVRLHCTNAAAHLEVRDNGCGLPPQYQSGVGLQAIKERTTELNGEYTLESLPDGGALVRAQLPLEVDNE